MNPLARLGAANLLWATILARSTHECLVKLDYHFWSKLAQVARGCCSLQLGLIMQQTGVKLEGAPPAACILALISLECHRPRSP